MSASAGLLRMAAQAGVVEVALASGGKPVTDRTPVNDWQRGSTANNTAIRFGPFPSEVRADQVLVWINGEGPDPLGLGSEMILPAGMSFVFDLALAIT